MQKSGVYTPEKMNWFKFCKATGYNVSHLEMSRF